jgi:hypothetical protein
LSDFGAYFLQPTYPGEVVSLFGRGRRAAPRNLARQIASNSVFKVAVVSLMGSSGLMALPLKAQLLAMRGDPALKSLVLASKAPLGLPDLPKGLLAINLYYIH